MRKRFAVLVIAVMLFVLSGCKSLSARGQQLLGNVSSYTHVAEYAKANLTKPEYMTSEGRYHVNVSVLYSVDEIKADASVVGKDFSYFWIEKDSVQFWNDETKTEGILYAFDVNEAVGKLSTTYKDMQVEKLKDNCYLVQQARAYIG